ncbi:lamin-like protein [Rosa chinensis]|uniref:lamin-like protein n=1 Tax=Rosa chinensis TaxID=74649 RepID=UPI000D08B655|nr:lamin-like protein [Rosa chinensis]
MHVLPLLKCHGLNGAKPTIESREPVLHRVGGGRFTWAPDINFTDWSSKEHFYVGDWLYFGFDKHIYNVLEVNRTSYENCFDKEYIYNVTRGGRDVFNLTEAKTYYFLGGRGYCYKGMKVAVFVEQTPPVLHHSPGFKSYPYSSTNFIIILTMLATWTIISY